MTESASPGLSDDEVRSLRAWHLFLVVALAVADAGGLLFSLALLTLDYLTAIYGLLLGLIGLLGLAPLGALFLARAALLEADPLAAYARALLIAYRAVVVWIAVSAVLLVASFPVAVVASAVLKGSGL